jgi:hypothetical protein
MNRTMSATKHFYRLLAVFLAACLSVLLFHAAALAAEPWRFGVMGDTQWKGKTDGRDTVPTELIERINREMIAAKVKFVIQVGDLADQYPSKSGNSMDTRAAAAQPLYAAGIGFYPLRGNHDESPEAAARFVQDFPQTQGAVNRFGATNFSSPGRANGLSYAFDYENARFVLLDQFAAPIADQQPWIDPILKTKPAGGHAFVFAHKGIVTENHEDTLFGNNPAENPEAQNLFMKSLYEACVWYYFGGHDHMHNRALVSSPDRLRQVHEIICTGNSYKFYGPKVPAPDQQFDHPPREIPLAQQLNAWGYYLVTVDGPRVTVDYYSASPIAPETPPPGGETGVRALPAKIEFVKRETFGYSLNGKQFLVRQGGPYCVVADTFQHTSAQIVGGVNGSVLKDACGRPLTKEITTGWTARADAPQADRLAGDVLTLWGMTDLGADHTDPFVLQMSYDPLAVPNERLAAGTFGLCSRDAAGNWAPAADANLGGKKRFLGDHPPVAAGPDTLGMYGYDSATSTVWAVINHPGPFAVGE